MGPYVRPYVRFADFTDVTLADKDIKSILTDNVNRAIQGNRQCKRAIQGNEAMQVMQGMQAMQFMPVM